MIVISNSSPLIYLAKIGKIDLLKKLFRQVFIPQEVYYEVVTKGREIGAAEVIEISDAVGKWIKVKKIKYRNKLEEFAPELDVGEIGVIYLAKKLGADIVLIDDASAAAVAKTFGLKCAGTIYVLLKAFKQKLISKREVIDLLDKLVDSGFRISIELYKKVLDEIS